MMFVSIMVKSSNCFCQVREGEVGVNLADGAWHTVNIILTIFIITMMITIVIMMMICRCEWGLPRKILPFVFLLMLLQV